jgi:hypothetical protein
MGLISFVFALFTIGYILGVWTACLVFRQPQREYEDGRHASPMVLARVPIIERILQ